MNESVAQRGIGEYLEALAGTQAMPGGGSAAGVVGALAAATAEMMASLTREPTGRLLESKSRLEALRERTLQCARDDEDSYGSYLSTLNLPKDTDEEKAIRRARLAETLEASARVPIALAQVSADIVEALEYVILDGNKTVLGDAEASMVMAKATYDICAINVRANLTYIRNEALATQLAEQLDTIGIHMQEQITARKRDIQKRTA